MSSLVCVRLFLNYSAMNNYYLKWMLILYEEQEYKNLNILIKYKIYLIAHQSYVPELVRPRRKHQYQRRPLIRSYRSSSGRHQGHHRNFCINHSFRKLKPGEHAREPSGADPLTLTPADTSHSAPERQSRSQLPNSTSTSMLRDLD